jgi:hypothetical protein
LGLGQRPATWVSSILSPLWTSPTHTPVGHCAARIFSDCLFEAASRLFVVEGIAPDQASVEPHLSFCIRRGDLAVVGPEVIQIRLRCSSHGCVSRQALVSMTVEVMLYRRRLLQRPLNLTSGVRVPPANEAIASSTTVAHAARALHCREVTCKHRITRLQMYRL